MELEDDIRSEPLVLVLDDGTRHVVTGIGLIGRAPHPHMGEEIADLFALPAPARNVTKTHASFGIENGRLWVCDRNSVAGTQIRKADGRTMVCPPGERVPVPDHASVLIGDRSFTVDQMRDGDTVAPATEVTPATRVAPGPTHRFWRRERS